MHEDTLELLGEKDTHKVFCFINNAFTKEKSTNVLLDSNLSYDYYDELVVRYGLYNFEEEYIALKNKDCNYEGILSFYVPTNKSRVFNLNLVTMKEFTIEKFERMLRFAIEKLHNLSLIQPSKIRITLKSNDTFFDFWKSVFYKAGFYTEVVRDRECEEVFVLYL